MKENEKQTVHPGISFPVKTIGKHAPTGHAFSIPCLFLLEGSPLPGVMEKYIF